TADADVFVLALKDTNLFLGGSFSSINGTVRRGLARIDSTNTGALDLNWSSTVSGGGFAPFDRFGGVTSIGSAPTNLYGELGERRPGPRVLLTFDADLLVGGSFLSV